MRSPQRDIRLFQPAIKGRFARLFQHRGIGIDAHGVPSAKPHREVSRNGFITTTKIDRTAKSQLWHLRQQVQRGPQAQMPERRIPRGIPAAHSHFLARKIAQGITADSSISPTAIG